MNTRAARLHVFFIVFSIVFAIGSAYLTYVALRPLLDPPIPILAITEVSTVGASDVGESVRPTSIASASAEPTERPSSTASARIKSSVSPLLKKLVTLPVGASLPSGSQCETLITKLAWEPRPSNKEQNETEGLTGVIVDGASEAWNRRFASRIDGKFSGTTDEILQWGACKWGFDVDGVRAVAVQESWWRMSTVGDSGESYGIMQVRNTYHQVAFPLARESTAYNVDYALGWRRACFDGDFTWLREKNPSYKSGDEWGCIGAWFSGNWYDGEVSDYWSGANWYIQEVKKHRTQKTWLQEDFME